MFFFFNSYVSSEFRSVITLLLDITLKYLQMSNFSFPDTPIILKGTVNDNGKYLTTHKLVCKNLKMPLHNYKLFFY